MNRDEAIRRLRASLDGPLGETLACAWLFGSVARDEAGGRSDLDVAVLMQEDPAPTLAASGLRLAGELERALGCEVDVVVLNRASVDLVHRVLRDGVLVLERDESARVRFEVRSRHAYLDLKPVLDLYRRAIGRG